MANVPAKITPYVAEVLRRECGGKGWTVLELAQRAGVDRSHLRGITGGKQSPKVDTLEKLTEALGLPLSGLFAEAERLRDAKR